jgi:TonB-linked SusC/RagA family outer membrane protein
MSLAIAQSKQVSGTVVDETGEPVIGASVIAKGTTIGTTTDLDGKFSLSVPENVSTVIVKYIGYVEVETPAATNARIVLNPDTQDLEEVVVTAMGITRQEKTLGYSATTVKGNEIAAMRNSNLLNSLSGKVAGLQVQSTSTDPGTASSVIIRGFGSMASGNNQPLYVVDGVPLQNISLSSAGNNNSVGHALSLAGAANISPDDIESTTILKGAAATALYGSRASTGAIIITTKKGQKGLGRNFNVEYNGGLQVREVALLPTFQNSFGQGWNGLQTFIENGSWGPRLDGSMQVYGPIWNSQQLLHKYEALENNVRDFFESPITTNHSISVSGVSNDNRMDYYLSYANASDDGIIPTKVDAYSRNTLAFRGGFQATDWLKISSTINVANYETDIANSYQGPSIIDGLYELPRDVSLLDMKDLNIPFNTPEAYFTPYGITNPYWAIANNYNHTDGKQLYGKIQADITPIKDLTLTYRYGFDRLDYDMKMAEPLINEDDALIENDYGYPPSSMNQGGYVYTRYYRSYEINHDFMANYKHDFDKFSINAYGGLNVNERYFTLMQSQSDKLAFNGFWDSSNGSSWSLLEESQNKRRMIGLFGDITLGYDDMLYLDLTGRNDWSSTLPLANNNYFYPGATLSWIFTRLIPQNDALSFGKIRLAYGKTGKDADIYLTNAEFAPAYSDAYYGFDVAKFPMNSTNAFLASTTASSNSLQPEMTTEFEIGANLQFVNGRIGLDAAYYDRTTDKQVFRLPVDPATGYTELVTNFGEVNNRGIELLLNLVPVKTKNFQWNLAFNFTYNKNKVVSMPEGLEGGKVEIYRYSAGNDAVNMYAEVGKPMGVYYTYLPQYVTDKKSEHFGKPIVDSYGQPVLGSTVEYTGLDMHHKWAGGITTSFTAYGVTLSATLDARYGGHMFSRTKNLMQFTGNSIVTTYNDRNPFIVPNSVVDNGDGTYSENTSPVKLSDSSYQDYFNLYGWGNGGLAYILDRSYAKLRNISLTWELPSKWVKPTTLSSISVSAFVNNAFIWTAAENHYIDPETSTLGSDLRAQFGELYSNPSCRIYGCNLSVKF